MTNKTPIGLRFAYSLFAILSVCLGAKPSYGSTEENYFQQAPYPNTLLQAVNIRLYPILGLPVSVFHIFAQQHEALVLKQIALTCNKVEAVYKRLAWGASPCLELPWKFDFISEQGYPLLYWEYASGGLTDPFGSRNTTIILGGVHADELTPVHMAFKLAKTIHDNPSVYQNIRVIIAPLVNPDGFFARPFKRMNANGVDLNRNFPTHQWNAQAYLHWHRSKERDKRKFPGNYANSEQGTRFQTDLIFRFHPDRIISVHAPLAFLDLDFDNKRLFHKDAQLTEDQKKAKEIASIISRYAGNYKIKDFGIYPGSLGNYAGNERTIPTITLELSSSDPRRVNKFWADFSPGILKALQYEFKPNQVAYALSY